MQQRTKIALAVALALPAMTAIAQEALQRVEVTGSRIRQVDLETAQPVQVMNAEQIQKSGLVTVGDIINSLSSAGVPAFSKGTSLGAGRDQGGQFLDMRNLGAQRLLVLVDGKRWSQSVNGYTDMSTVPSALIERVEILKDGASSIYGSDAISGVVNIILKKTMQGGQASIYHGQNEKNDGKTKDYSLSYGAGDDKASLLFGVTHTEQGEVWAKTRDITSTTNGPDRPNASLGSGPWGRIRQVSPTGGPTGFDRILNHTGAQLGDGVGADSRDPNNYHTFGNAPADLFNSTSQMHFLTPSKLTSLFVKGEVALPWNMNFKTTAMYADRKSSRTVAGYPLSSTAQSKFPVYVDKDSYYNPYGNQVAGAGNGQDLFFYRRTIEVPRVTDNSSRTLHIDATLEGEFELRSLPWNWSVGYNHSKVDGLVQGYGDLNLVNLKRALGPSFRNASGVVQCGTVGAPIGLAECTPWNILGGPSASTQEALDYVMSTSQATYSSVVNSATADITGELFTLPAGAVGVAAGIEHREVRGDDIPGQFEQSGYSSSLAGNATYGRYTVREAYLEANIPLLKGLPAAELLSLNLATRYSDYSNFGSTTNSKASFMWKPVRDVLARGTYAEGFRAPTLGDTFGGGSQTFASYLDVCDSAFGEAANNPTVAARCAAAGVPAGFRQKNQTGGNVSATGAQTPFPFTTGAGNAFLQPESAKTRTLGLVISPSGVPGLSVSVDWFNIRIENRISGVSATDTLEECYVNNVQNFCSLVKRDASGQVVDLQIGNTNRGKTETEGVDLAINYRLPRTAWGQFGIRSETTYTDSFKEQSTLDSDWVEYAGEYDIFRVKSNTSIDWSLGNWNATFTGRFYSSQKNRCWTANPAVYCSDPTAETSWGTGYNRHGEMWYADLSIGYALPWNAKILFGANNLFDKKPEINYSAASSTGGNSSSSAVSPELPIDRFFYVRYNQAF
ncbi:TonB-dependent receptor [Massilia sp. CFBP9012]|uniref:TonB-dependent receptor domain-containing protein n=1 Tax=Massilia sp. CFBP9012 TaxID=3096531 RepID=UPI002A6ADCAC|nr:TonB-dependent receptor [Massilia sp. CFBP9012]MDY0974250.1 TonB-dependent receptor [Massilia sp. CFBP9012]